MQFSSTVKRAQKSKQSYICRLSCTDINSVQSCETCERIARETNEHTGVESVSLENQ